MLMFNDWGGASRAFNLDGVVAYSGSPERVGAYTQVYRNGMMEAVRMGGHSFMERPVVPSTTVSTFYRDAISKYVHFAKQAYLAGPIMVTAALIGVDGHEFGIGGNFFLAPLRFQIALT
ncbi:hypothetical protein PIB19_14330 [Sphingomonas sp. 7/4-4]|uniref:hypothetical protein n=1 Tax=Sphingomonas sp. 7/4-4 TaxID=3018446 RepID=UPI0022F39F36|nr:hypothetical protein [Sphingomonas sp. 7/4-4]WBY06710.1 hypothetical protein PIB19_14330 [Sphingomonas sp. 7/4-4]